MKTSFSFLSFFALLFAVLLFTACGNSEPPVPDSVFSAKAEIEYKDMTVVCDISTSGTGNLRINITKPEELSGFSYLWNYGSFKIGYLGLYCENESSPLPEDSFASQLYSFVSRLGDESNFSFVEKTDDGCLYKMLDGTRFTVDSSDGRILSADFENMKVRFFEHSDA